MLKKPYFTFEYDFDDLKKKLKFLENLASILEKYLRDKKTYSSFEINKTMISLWELLKFKENLLSEIELKNVLEVKEEKGLFLFLDNFISHFSPKDLEKMLENKESVIIEYKLMNLDDFNGNKKEKTLVYYFNGRKIKEKNKVLELNKDWVKIEKIVYNGIAKAKMEQFFYERIYVLKLLRKYFGYIEILNENSNQILIFASKDY